MRAEERWLAGAVVLAVLIVAVAATHRSGDGRPSPEGAAASSSVTASATRTPTLPADSAYGRAVLVYAPCSADCGPVVVFADGREFEIFTDSTDPGAATLSPDGRWLGYPFGTGYVIRDLIGLKEFRIASPGVDRRMFAQAWSPDSSTLLLGDYPDGQRAAFTLVDLNAVGLPLTMLNAGDNAARTPVTVSAGYVPIGVRTPTEVVMIRPDLPGPRVEVVLTVGGDLRLFTLDASARLLPGERLLPQSVRLNGPGIEAVVIDATERQVAVLRFNQSSGEMFRYDLPMLPDPGTWTMLGVGPDGTALARRGQGRTQVWYLTVDGGLRADREFPGEIVVVPPGAVRR